MSDKTFKLLGADSKVYRSPVPGTLGGHRKRRIYGRLDCSTALRAIANGGYVAQRVFFADEAVAIAAKYRPCFNCMRERFRQWNRGGELGTPEYPWLVEPNK